MATGHCLLLAAALMLLPPNAAGETAQPAPMLATPASHAVVRSALDAVVRTLAEPDQKRVVGMYAAFHGDARDPTAFAACDDDGDYVVVLSDAMLTLAEFVAHAAATPDSLATGALERYARLLATEQRVGERLLPPPPGVLPTYESEAPRRARDELAAKAFRALVTHLVAAEVAHVLAGDVRCPHPTATHERGDDVWTPEEHRAALRQASAFHTPKNVVTADVLGTQLALAAGEPEDAIASFLSPFCATVERNAVGRDVFTYLQLHPSSSVRAQIVRTAAASYRAHHSLRSRADAGRQSEGLLNSP
jgi:hypothetical protein